MTPALARSLLRRAGTCCPGQHMYASNPGVHYPATHHQSICNQEVACCFTSVVRNGIQQMSHFTSAQGCPISKCSPLSSSALHLLASARHWTE